MAKGGAFEHTVIRKIAEAFKPLGIQEDDIFRTKNSGATKSQPGDIQFSPAMAKLWPVLVECKHYKQIQYKFGKSLSGQTKSSQLFMWWKQVIREQKEQPKKMGILVFRLNGCPIVVALRVDHYQHLFGGYTPNWMEYSWATFTSWKKESIVMLRLDEFLPKVVDKIKRKRIMKQRSR